MAETASPPPSSTSPYTPSAAARIVEIGVLNNHVADGLDLESLKSRAIDDPVGMQGRWQGQFRFAQADGQSPDISDITLTITHDGTDWAIKGETPYSGEVPGTDIDFADKTLSFGLESGLYTADKRPFPYLVDLVLIEDELRGLIRMRLRTLGDLHSDKYHTMWLKRVEGVETAH